MSGAAQISIIKRYNQRMPRSRTPKGRQQAESRHSCRVLYSQSASIFRPTRNDTWVVPPYSNVTSLPFLSGSGESVSAPIPLDGIGFVAAGNSSTKYGYSRISTTKSKEQKSPCLKFLKVLRKLLSRSFLSRVWDRVSRS